MSSNGDFDALPQALKDVVTHPTFQSVVANIQNLPASSERSQAVLTQLTPKALADKGIHLPEGYNITTPAQKAESTTFARDAGPCVFCITDRRGFEIYCFPEGCVH